MKYSSILKVKFNIILISLMLILEGCTFSQFYIHDSFPVSNLCKTFNFQEGNDSNIIFLWETAWRKDQKEPDLREQMIRESMNNILENFKCSAQFNFNTKIENINWGSQLESAIIQKYSQRGFDTIVLIRVEELTPTIQITLSLPFLWSSTNEADLRIRAISVKNQKILMDRHIKRVKGGVFQLRPASWSRYELEAILRQITSGL